MAGPSLGNIVFLLAATLGGSYQPQPVIAVNTPKSLQTFAACFAEAQDKAGMPWAFVPSDRGGSFSNEGASAGSSAYRLQVFELRAGNELRLFASGNAARAALAKAVNRCR